MRRRGFVAEIEIESHGPAETAGVGERLAGFLGAGDLLLLEGDLGAGKTCLTQGLARGLGVAEPVTSPTFTLVNVYDGRTRVYHVDLYRLESGAEATELGLDELLESPAITVVEWPERLPGFWPEHRIEITIAHLAGDHRRLSLRAYDTSGARVLAGLQAQSHAAGD